MTLIELSIGLVLTSMVVAALGAVWYAVARTWEQTSGLQATTLTASHAVGRLEQTLRESKYVLQYRRGALNNADPSGTAMVLLWRKDIWNAKALSPRQDMEPHTIANGAVEAAELVLIEHDPATRRLYVWEAIRSAEMTEDQRTRAGVVLPLVELTATPMSSKKFDFMRKRVFCEAVDGAVVNVPSWGRAARPSLEFALRLSRGGDKSVVYGQASLRGPMRPD